MDFLLDNPLVLLDGPAFLVLYVSLILILILSASVLRSNADRTDLLNVPAIPHEPDPFEIAFFRGGENEAARAVVFSLLHKGYVECVTEGKRSVIAKAPLPPGEIRLQEIERKAAEWIGESRTADELFKPKGGLVERLQPHFEIYRSDLEAKQVLTSTAAKKHLRRTAGIAAGAAFAVGLYKVGAALFYGHFNVIFTLILAVIGAGIILKIGSLPRITKLGRIYLSRLELAFDDLKRTSQAPYLRTAEARSLPAASFASVDPLTLSVGIFGGAVLAGTVFDSYNSAFQRAQHNAGTSGACGSACGSGCSSGGEGGSCSSSGCGGGGCGG
jgi:uncharacterized protein (TIGR04222 family)